jgi:hypothetical protein
MNRAVPLEPALHVKVQVAKNLGALDAAVYKIIENVLARGFPNLGKVYGDCIAFFSLSTGERDPIFMPMFIYDMPLAALAPEAIETNPTFAQAQTLAEAALVLAPNRFTARQAAYLRSQSEARVSYWKVANIVRGESLTLRDLGSDKEVLVFERTGSLSIRAHSIACGRVVTRDGVSILSGLGPHVLPPKWEAGARAALAALLKGPTKASTNFGKRAHYIELLFGWLMLERAYLEVASRPPTLQNTDGDELLVSEQSFSFRIDARASIVRVLEKLEGVEVDTERDQIHITFSKGGNAMHASWDNTIVGSLQIKASSMVLQTNSEARHRSLTDQIQKAAGSLVKPGLRAIHSTERMLADAKEHALRGETSAPSMPHASVSSAEVEAMKAQMMLDYERTWPTTAIPALGNETPAALMKTKAGRVKVLALLEQYEFQEGTGGSGFAARLRAQLGL